MGISPSQPVALSPEPLAEPEWLSSALLESLWQESEASACGLARTEFAAILLAAGAKQNYGQPPGADPAPERKEAYLRSLRLADLTLARACAQGVPLAWDRFLALYRQPLTRAAIAIAGSDTQGRELADALYAELYGLQIRDGQRRSPLDSYQGRGSLLGWLRTTLAQRHVDRHRKTWREEPLPEQNSESPANGPHAPDSESISSPESSPEELTLLASAVEHCLAQQPPEDRFLLAAYYLDQRTLAQIARTLQVHEATVSRKLRRTLENLRSDLLRNLQRHGLSKRAAQEALAADPRDLTGVTDFERNLRKLLQLSASGTFPEKAGL